jgi:hypothetical protein
MKVLSIDIGLKHLAHCLLDTTLANPIVDWQVIDLTERFCSCGAKAEVQLKHITKCKRHADASTKGLVECIAQCTEVGLPLGTIDEMRHIILKNTKKLDVMSVEEISKSIIRNYDTLSEIHVVLVENQIGPLASKMKMIQGMVIQYWVSRNAKIECISSCNKLKLFHVGKTTYAQRKKLSIQHTLSILESNHMDVSSFSKHKKKDDLADTFLQGIWYLHNCGILNIKSS